MDRRCTSEQCLVTASGRPANLGLSLAEVLTDPQSEWPRLTGGRGRVARDLNVDWNTFNSDTHIFSHATIVGSVNVEDNGYYIDPVCSPLVNNNGNAWSNPVLLATFRSFVGGENYLEHVQCPEFSKGKILDAVIRPVRYHNAKLNRDAQVYYTDILLATERKHEKLCKRIASGELSTLSMGCVAAHVQCSRCGKVLGDHDPNCDHIAHQLGQEFVDEDGVKRVVAELCGRAHKDKNGAWVGDPESVKFIEASWVERPAFEGAVLNHFLSDVPKAASKVMDFPTDKLEQTMEELFRTRVADTRGMIVLRVAMEEMNRRRRQAMAARVAKTFWD